MWLCIALLAVPTAELGDYEQEEHSPELVSEFRFVPNQTEQMELDITEKFRALR